MLDNIDMQKEGSYFTERLMAWYGQNKRNLPWRESGNPYLVWLSEIILQQTRIDQGTAYFLKFAETYHTVHALAEAPEDDVFRLWQGLGYYSRARNLHAAAKMVVSCFGGKFPEEYQQLLGLPGVGPYTAAAIASICFGKKHAVVDGNVYRLLSRWFGIETPIDTTKGQKQFSALAQDLIPDYQPGDFNQAMMDFGAMVCKPALPLCDTCPLAAGCFAKSQNRVSAYPAKAGKVKVRNRYLLYVIPLDKHGNTLLKKRTDNDIWKGLYEFPLIEFDNLHSFESFADSDSFADLNFGNAPVISSFSGVRKHQLSHQKLHLIFVYLHVEVLHPDAKHVKVSLSELDDYALPRALTRFLEETASS